MKYVKGNVVVLVVMSLFVVAVSYYAWQSIQQKRINILHDSAAFSVLTTGENQSPYTDLEGNSITLTDYFGQILVVSSWGSWCPACTVDLPLLSTLAESHKDDGVKILAINRSEPATTAERFLRTVNATTGVLLVLDPDDRFYKSIGGYAMPETIFYDRSGNIVYHAHGSISLDEMNLHVEEALARSIQNK